MLGALTHETTHGHATTEARHSQNIYEDTALQNTQESRAASQTHGQRHHSSPAPRPNHHPPMPHLAARLNPATARNKGTITTTRTTAIGATDQLPAEEAELATIVDYKPPKRTPAPNTTHAKRTRTTKPHGTRHTRASIHRRHLARVAYHAALKQYHLQLLAWRHALTERERLLRRLIALEHRLTRQPQTHHTPATGTTFEIEGQWFHQVGHHRAILLHKAPV